jgi:hypothetical protein
MGSPLISNSEMTRDEYGEDLSNGIRSHSPFSDFPRRTERHSRGSCTTAWTKGWERFGQLRSDGLVNTWVNAIAMNAYRHILRKERSHEALPELPAGETDLAAIDVRRILRSCRTRDRILLELHIRGETTEEIARKEGVTPTAVRLRLLRARRRVRSQVAGENKTTRKLRRAQMYWP